MAKSFAPIFAMVTMLALFTGTSSGHPVASTYLTLISPLVKLKETMVHVTTLVQKCLEIYEVQRQYDMTFQAVVYLGQSLEFCGHLTCTEAPGDAYYDADSDTCICPWTKLILVCAVHHLSRFVLTDFLQLRLPNLENAIHPTAKCAEQIECAKPLYAFYNPFADKCVCSMFMFPPTAEIPLPASKPNKTILQEVDPSRLRFLTPSPLPVLKNAKAYFKAQEQIIRRRQSSDIPDAVPLAPLPTFVPPSKTDITPALISQSLAVKPQQNAIVHSAIPHFADGVITFYVQLDGPVPQSLQLNATDSMPCDTIGTGAESNLVLVPRNVNNGTREVVIPDCLIIAVNKLNATWINYWVQKNDGSGSIHSVIGDAQVHNIDQLDTSKPAALSIRVSTAVDYGKRALMGDSDTPVHMKRQKVLPVNCDNPCMINGKPTVQGPLEVCSCLADEVDHISLRHKAVEAPGLYTAVMTAEACTAMTCINNGGKPALFNPFNKSCWCAAPTFVEVNEHAPIA